MSITSRVIGVLIIAVLSLSANGSAQERPGAAGSNAAGAQQKPEPARDQYVPIDQIPPTERMPSAPFVIAAYAVIWALAMFYLWTIWRRAARVEDDLQALARRQRDAAR